MGTIPDKGVADTMTAKTTTTERVIKLFIVSYYSLVTSLHN